MPRTSRRATSRTLVSVAAALGLGLILSGCSAGFGIGAATSEFDTARLHPHGPSGAWFSDDYADGVTKTFATSDTLCGIATPVTANAATTPDIAPAIDPNIAIVSVTGPDRGSYVEARRLGDGAMLWQRAGFNCVEGALLDGFALVTSSDPAAGGPAELIDPLTGSTAVAIIADERIGRASQLGRADDLRVIDAGERLIGVKSDGGIAWTFANDFANSIETLDDGYFALIGPNERLAVLDGRTGTLRTELSGLGITDVTWASDGYVVRINQSDPEYAFYDLDGEEVGRTVKKSQYSFVPQPSKGVTFTIEDHMKAGRAVGVNETGDIVLWQTSEQKDRSRSGDIRLPDSIISLGGVSASGDTLLFHDQATDGFVLIDGDANTLFTWPVPTEKLRIEAGYLVVQNGTGSIVLLP